MLRTHLNQEKYIGPDISLLDGLRLLSAPGVAIKQPAVLLHVILLQAVLHHVHHNLIGDEEALVHELLRLHSSFRPGCDLSSEQVANGYVDEAKLHPTALPAGTPENEFEGTRLPLTGCPKQ